MIGEYLICPVHLKNDFFKTTTKKKQEAGGDLEAPPEPEFLSGATNGFGHVQKEMSVFTPFIYQ